MGTAPSLVARSSSRLGLEIRCYQCAMERTRRNDNNHVLYISLLHSSIMSVFPNQRLRVQVLAGLSMDYVSATKRRLECVLSSAKTFLPGTRVRPIKAAEILVLVSFRDMKLGTFQFLREQLAYVPPVKYEDLSGKTVVVIGANIGLGFEAAKHFAKMKPGRLILGCRSKERGDAAVASEINPLLSCLSYLIIHIKS